MSDAYHLGKRGIPEVALPWVCRARAELFQRFVAPDAVVFEFGCGWGWNLGALRCRQRLGYDVAPQVQPSVAKLGIEFIRDPQSLEKGGCDVILCHHALEHVIEPSIVLRDLRRLLAPGGKLLIAVPYERQRRYRRYDPREPNHHLYAWNVQTLGALVTLCGCRVTSAKLRTYGYDRRAATLGGQLGLGETGFRWVRGILRRLRPIEEVAIEAAIDSGRMD